MTILHILAQDSVPSGRSIFFHHNKDKGFGLKITGDYELDEISPNIPSHIWNSKKPMFF